MSAAGAESARSGQTFEPATLLDVADHASATRMVQMFAEQAAERLPDLEGAVERGDFALVDRLAHMLKGSCATVGAPRAATICQAISGAAQHHDGVRAAEQLMVLSDAVEETTAQMRAYLAEHVTVGGCG